MFTMINGELWVVVSPKRETPSQLEVAIFCNADNAANLYKNGFTVAVQPYRRVVSSIGLIDLEEVKDSVPDLFYALHCFIDRTNNEAVCSAIANNLSSFVVSEESAYYQSARQFFFGQDELDDLNGTRGDGVLYVI
jgi:hypothetical protein